MKKCNVCQTEMAKFILEMNTVKYPYCRSCLTECEPIIKASGVVYTITTHQELPTPTKHQAKLERLRELEIESKGKKALTTEERDHQSQLRIIEGIRSKFNKTE